ncbi:MAG: hypothetical protein R2694_07975 [Ilumatobacteraceae bacterium]
MRLLIDANSEVDLQGRLSNPHPPTLQVVTLLLAIIERPAPRTRSPKRRQVQHRPGDRDCADLDAPPSTKVTIDELAVLFEIHHTTVMAHLTQAGRGEHCALIREGR